MNAGRLIVFEGIDGMGKSSQLALLADVLRGIGLPVITTREPTDGPHGRVIREMFIGRDRYSPEEELAAFIADRRWHVEHELRPRLAAGIHVLCDRYYLSTIAYQGAKGLDTQAIIAAHAFAPPPDLAFLLDAPPDVGIGRIRQRGDLPNDFERLDSLEKTRRIFASLTFPFIRRIDAGKPMRDVHQAICAAALPLFAMPHP
ncbi:MAG: dTMP kinase [Desulfobulbaceae bacterium]|jgi:dTMP kinase|nr:dTMP kinase [Desulfobulbaceae bacterium]